MSSQQFSWEKIRSQFFVEVSLCIVTPVGGQQHCNQVALNRTGVILVLVMVLSSSMFGLLFD
jgi:hypothetical protein